MSNITSEQINKAKNVDLVSLCQANGIELFERPGERGQLRWTEHDSLVISTKKNIFKWWSQDNVGGDAINFAREVLGKESFVEAVRFLTEGDYSNAEIIQEEKKPFEYKFKNSSDFQRAKGYLLERGIDSQIINCLHDKGFLQEVQSFDFYSQTYKPHLAFVWSKSGVVSGTTIQNLSINILEDGEISRDKPRIVKNSELDFGFNLTIGKPETLYFFEGAVDLLSYWSLNKNIENAMMVSLEGVKEVTINNFLNYSFYAKGIVPNEVVICTDNDVAGHSLNDKFRGKQFVDENGQLMKFRSEIPQDNYVPEKNIEMYHDVLSKSGSSLPINWLAAVHKAITNFSDDGNAVTNQKTNNYFAFDKERDGEHYDVKSKVEQFVSDFDKSGFTNEAALNKLLVIGKWTTADDEQLISKVKDYITTYDNEGMIVSNHIVKDWNDVVIGQQDSLPHQLKLTQYGNERNEEVNIEYDPSSEKPFKGIKKGEKKQPVLFFEAESMKEAQTLAKAYGFYALDKEDSRKYNIKNKSASDITKNESSAKKIARQLSY